MSFFTTSPFALCASVLGLSLAVTGCATANSQSPSLHPHHQLQDGQTANPLKQMQTTWHKKHQGKKGEMQDMHGGMHRMIKQLNLTDAQKAQVQQLQTQYQAQMQQLKNTLAQYDKQIAQQKQAGASTATLLTLHKQKQTAMSQFMSMHTQHQQQLLNILTPEQQLKLYELKGMKMHGGMHSNLPDLGQTK